MNVGGVTVLLIEDDESLRRFVARHLRSEGRDVALAGTAEEANELIASGLRPAVVLLDLNLPGDTGWDFLRGPALGDAGAPPVLITSATSVTPRRIAEFGVAGYLPKPFPLETLSSTIDRLIIERRAVAR
jgi:DNA-binding response OmpR family regulator